MFLNNAFQHGRRAGVIPDAFRINHCDGAVRADAKAICLGAVNQRVWANKIQFLKAAFQIFPRLKTLFLRGAVRLGLVRAQKNVPPVLLQTQRFDNVVQFIRHAGIMFRVGARLQRGKTSEFRFQPVPTN